MFNDPERTLNIGSFTAFVFVCLNVRCQHPTHSPEPLMAAERLARNSSRRISRWRGGGRRQCCRALTMRSSASSTCSVTRPPACSAPAARAGAPNPPLPSIPTRLASPIGGACRRPRLDFECPNRCGLIYLPESVREQFLDADSESTPVTLPTNHTRGFACARVLRGYWYVQPRDVNASKFY